MRRFIPIPILLAGLLGAGASTGSETAAEEQSELQARLDQARQEVQESARRLAEVVKDQMGDDPQAKVSEWLSWDTGGQLGVMIDSDDGQGGVLVREVSPGSGAEAAGLLPGDRLTAVDGVPLDQGGGPKALLDHMKTVEAGQEVTLAVLRDGAAEQVDVVAQPRSMRFRHMLDGLDLDIDIDLDDLDLDGFEAMGRRGEATDVPRLVDIDADLGAYFGVDQGVLVLNAPEDGALKSGDVLLSVGGEAVASARQARRAIAAADKPVEAEVMRQRSKLSLSIAPDAFPRHLGKRIRIVELKEEELP